jgi:hypothetical protein
MTSETPLVVPAIARSYQRKVLMSKINMVNCLLRSLDQAREADDPHAAVRTWSYRVVTALASAGLAKESENWASNYDNFSVSDEPQFRSEVGTMMAVLEGILGNLKSLEPSEASEELFSMEFVRETKHYIKFLAEQANDCYRHGWYDACAVILRRLIEILIIECFEKKKIEHVIKDKDGNYYMLEALIKKFRNETAWQVGRNLRNNFEKLDGLKKVGDMGAHGKLLVSVSHLKDLRDAAYYVLQGLVDIAYE